jgi:hypothetical protein
MYNEYVNYLKNINAENIRTRDFKSNPTYNSILEHVSNQQGRQYLALITEEFPEIESGSVKQYAELNDKYGVPSKHPFRSRDGTLIYCSPTSLRYVYHALVILRHFKLTGCKSFVEVGCGYGGLFLAICFFSQIVGVEVENYHLVDFPEVGNLIQHYIQVNSSNFKVKPAWFLHDCHKYGETVPSEDGLFFISNYCFTEIDHALREKYIQTLLGKVSNGFIVWQTVFGCDIQLVNTLRKTIRGISEETPQTCPHEHAPNYFVYF